MYNNYQKLIDIFENLTGNPTGWDDETLNKISGLLGYLNGFLFCFLVHIFQKILEQSSIVYSILQDKETDFQYGMSRVERFKIFVTSLRTDAKYSEFYDNALEEVGPPVTRYDQRHNYKQIFFEILDSIVGMLTERFEDMERFKLTQGYLGLGKKLPQRKLIFSRKCMMICLIYQCLLVNFLSFTGIRTSIKILVESY